MSETRYYLEVVPVQSDGWGRMSESARLSRLAKSMLRSYGFKITKCRRQAPERAVFRALEDAQDASGPINGGDL